MCLRLNSMCSSTDFKNTLVNIVEKVLNGKTLAVLDFRILLITSRGCLF